MSEFTVLDVGCGGTPKGDVNCDLFIGKTPHVEAIVRKTEYFVRCDAQHLPFRDKSFQIVHSSHLLEHLLQPYDALLEFKRVSTHIVYLRLPNSESRFSQHQFHFYAWDYNTFHHLLQTIFSTFQLYTGSKEVFHGRLTNRFWILKRILTLVFRKVLPDELTAICSVKKHCKLCKREEVEEHETICRSCWSWLKTFLEG